MPSDIGHFAREPPINTLQPAQLGIILNSELCLRSCRRSWGNPAFLPQSLPGLVDAL